MGKPKESPQNPCKAMYKKFEIPIQAIALAAGIGIAIGLTFKDLKLFKGCLSILALCVVLTLLFTSIDSYKKWKSHSVN